MRTAALISVLCVLSVPGSISAQFFAPDPLPTRVVVGRLSGLYLDHRPLRLGVVPDGGGPEFRFRYPTSPVFRDLAARWPWPGVVTGLPYVPDGSRVRLTAVVDWPASSGQDAGRAVAVEVLPAYGHDPDLALAVAVEGWLADSGAPCPRPIRSALAPLGSADWLERDVATRAYEYLLASGNVAAARALAWGRRDPDAEVRRRAGWALTRP